MNQWNPFHFRNLSNPDWTLHGFVDYCDWNGIQSGVFAYSKVLAFTNSVFDSTCPRDSVNVHLLQRLIHWSSCEKCSELAFSRLGNRFLGQHVKRSFMSCSVLLLDLHPRIHLWVNQKRLGINQNRAKCVCAARGIWVLSLDSDDDFLNRTTEIAVNTHGSPHIDMSVSTALIFDVTGRCHVLGTSQMPFSEADNTTFPNICWRLILG
jgi:hypothetical protein